jgi:hypothetical protein
MHFSLQETFADSAGTQRPIDLRLFVSHHLLNGCLAPGATLNVDIQIAIRTDGAAPFRLTLSDKFATGSDPASESFNSPDDVIPTKLD